MHVAVVVDGAVRSDPRADLSRCAQVRHVEHADRRIEAEVALVQLVMHEQVATVFGPPARVREGRVRIRLADEQLPRHRIGDVPDVDRVLVEVRQHLALRLALSVDALSVLARVLDRERRHVVRVAQVRHAEQRRRARIGKRVQPMIADVEVGAGDAEHRRRARLRDAVGVVGVHHVVGVRRAMVRREVDALDAVRQSAEIQHHQQVLNPVGRDVRVGAPALRAGVEHLVDLDVTPRRAAAGRCADLLGRARIGDVENRDAVLHADERVLAAGVEIGVAPDVVGPRRDRFEDVEGQVRQQADRLARETARDIADARRGRLALLGARDLRGELAHAARFFAAHFQSLRVGDHREAGRLEAIAKLRRHADQHRLTGRVALGVAAVLAEAGVDAARDREQIEQLRRLADGVAAFGNLDRVALAGLRDRVAQRAARPEAIEAVALVAARAGDVTGFAVVGRCWEDATR